MEHSKKLSRKIAAFDASVDSWLSWGKLGGSCTYVKLLSDVVKVK